MKITYLFQTLILLLPNMLRHRKVYVIRVLLLIFLIPLLMNGMDNDSFAITIVGVRDTVLKEETKRFVREKDELFKQADQNFEYGLCSLFATSVWLSKIFCINGFNFQPTMTDAYVLGCTCSLSCGFCIGACCNCAKAITLKQE